MKIKRILSITIIILLVFSLISLYAGDSNEDNTQTENASKASLSLEEKTIDKNSNPIVDKKLTQDERTALFKAAVEDYRKGQYSTAADKFLKIYRDGIQNHILLYNLGNCYYRMNKIGHAVLMWEKALKLEPNDEATRQNLEFASRKLQDKFEPGQQHFIGAILSGIASMLDADGWTILTIIIFWITGILFFIFQTTKKHTLKRVAMYLSALLLLLTIISVAFTAAGYNELRNEQYAVLLADKIQVKSGPSTNNPTLFILHEGVKMKIEGEQDNWMRISLPNGYNGWIPADSIGII